MSRYVKNSYNLVIKRQKTQFKNGQGISKNISPKRHTYGQ